MILQRVQLPVLALRILPFCLQSRDSFDQSRGWSSNIPHSHKRYRHGLGDKALQDDPSSTLTGQYPKLHRTHHLCSFHPASLVEAGANQRSHPMALTLCAF